MKTEFPWLETLHGAAAVDVAARCGLLADIAAGGECPDRPALLENLLVGVKVVFRDKHGLSFTPEFAAAWRAESAAIMARASFIRRAAADVATGLDQLVFDVPTFMESSATFRLFRYDQADGTTPNHLSATRRWVDYVEALSQNESPFLTPIIDVRDGDRVLEIGGNTGLMSAALIATHAGVTSRVLDLPAVCALGRERRDIPGLKFVEGDARKPDALADFRGSVDVVLFKSVLHDWPAEDAAEMLLRAIEILPPGGRVIVCERAAFSEADVIGSSMTTLTNIVFAPFYRDEGFYRDIMEQHGLLVTTKSVQIDMVFHATTGARA